MKTMITELKCTLTSIKKLNNLEKAILLSVTSLFLPYQFSAVVLGLVVLYSLYTHQLIPSIKEQTGALWLYGFIGLELVVSCFYQNTIGILNTFGILLIGLFIAIYRKALTPQLFSMIILEVLLLSWLAAGYGLYEYYKICTRNQLNMWEWKVLSRPKNRINSTFMNANFYATMIEFFLVFCLYQWSINKNKVSQLFCIATAALNVFMLRLTGCRTAFLPLVVLLPLYFLISKEKFWLKISLGVEALGLVLVRIIPSLFPRSGQFSTLSSRIKIWKASIQGILEHPLFGQGPQTYTLVYQRLNAKKAPHAHNIYLDTLLSYGIVGTLILLGYFWNLIKETWALYRTKKNLAICAMIACFYAIALIHGLLDVTLNFLPTGCLFFMILNSSSPFEVEK